MTWKVLPVAPSSRMPPVTMLVPSLLRYLGCYCCLDKSPQVQTLPSSEVPAIVHLTTHCPAPQHPTSSDDVISTPDRFTQTTSSINYLGNNQRKTFTVPTCPTSWPAKSNSASFRPASRSSGLQFSNDHPRRPQPFPALDTSFASTPSKHARGIACEPS